MLPRFASSNIVLPVLLGAAAIGAASWIFYRGIRRVPSPAEVERSRRLRLHVRGRMTEAVIARADEHSVHYAYKVAGVIYYASQDLTMLQAYLRVEPHLLVGAALAKFDPRNPADSILICEQWSGIAPEIDKYNLPKGA